MKLIRLKPDSDVNEMVDYLYKRHEFYLKESVVSRQQIAKLVSRLQNRLGKENKQAPKKLQPAAGHKRKAEEKKTTNTSIPSSYMPSLAPKKVENGGGWDDNGWGDDGWGDNDANEDKDYNEFNLNKLGIEELEKEKAKMDVQFEKNKKKPGDKDFVYDLQVDFKPAKEA
jgi:hypothetical protein